MTEHGHHHDMAQLTEWFKVSTISEGGIIADFNHSLQCRPANALCALSDRGAHLPDIQALGCSYQEDSYGIEVGGDGP